MADPLSIAGAIVTFGELAMTIKESIDKVGDNKEILANLEKEVSDTVKELKSLAQGFGDEEPTGELLTALENLTGQLEVISNRCQALAQSKGVSGFVKAWFKRDKIEAEIKKLKENRTNCFTQFQLLSLARVEGTTARTEEHTILIEATATRTEEYAARTEATTTRTEATTARIEANSVQLVNSEREKKIREWFQALDMREKQRATYAFRHNDTGRWVLEGTEFAKWKEPGCLWIRGISGTGKSVLSSIAIDHLFDYRPVKVANSHTDTPNFAIAYFYFDFREETKQLLDTMLRSIIMQLSEQSATPYSVLDQHFKSYQGGKLPTHGDLLAMLDTLLNQFTGTYIILDALDECSEHDELIKFISTLRRWGKPVHLLVASQPRTIFLDFAAFEEASVVVIEQDTTHADILQFVKSELELNSKLKHIKKAKDAAQKIVEKSNGMFRMAACLLQELARKRIDTSIDKILAKLPNDLSGIYTRFLQLIDEGDLVYVAALLRWIAFSARPVSLRGLDEALAINFSEPAEWVFEPENRGRVEVVCDLLEGLVVVGPTTAICDRDIIIFGQFATLAHSSVKDYTVSERFLEPYKQDLREAPSHTFLAQSCVAYLLHFENNPLDRGTMPQYPLARYAARYWSYHLIRCHDRDVLQRSTMHILKEGCHGAIVNAAGGGYGSALQGAAAEGSADIVRLLLDHGADVNVGGGTYGSALQCAASKGSADIVRLLLDHGADVNVGGRNYDSALQCAASKGSADIVRLLLDHGADVNAAGGRYGSALQSAALNGHTDIVRLLLDHGADVNAAGGRYGSALQSAALNGHTDIVRILEKGTDVNAVDKIRGNALAAASEKGHGKIVKLLREHGALEVESGGNSDDSDWETQYSE
ncbi:hypothetical protein DFH06DRAFT_1432623 [Mycena polygramma]|nr:hypothetical protein DFH06DRAFT_1432623 [Mycena polygramma]